MLVTMATECKKFENAQKMLLFSWKFYWIVPFYNSFKSTNCVCYKIFKLFSCFDVSNKILSKTLTPQNTNFLHVYCFQTINFRLYANVWNSFAINSYLLRRWISFLIIHWILSKYLSLPNFGCHGNYNFRM